MAIPLYIFVTLLMWDWEPVRILAGVFLLIMLDLWVKCTLWDKSNERKAKEEKEKRERLQKLKRGEDLYIYNEPWYQNLSSEVKIEEEKETSPPSSKPKKKLKEKRKRTKLENKIQLYRFCRCIYKQSQVMLVFAQGKEVNYKMKKPIRPKYHRRN